MGQSREKSKMYTAIRYTEGFEHNSIFSQNVFKHILFNTECYWASSPLCKSSPLSHVLDHVLSYILLNMSISLQYVLRMFASISSPIKNVLDHVLSYAKCSWACSLLRMFLRMFFLSYAKCFWAYCLLKDALVNALSNTECSWLCSFLNMQNFLAHLSKRFWFLKYRPICPESGKSLYLTCICINFY